MRVTKIILLVVVDLFLSPVEAVTTAQLSALVLKNAKQMASLGKVLKNALKANLGKVPKSKTCAGSTVQKNALTGAIHKCNHCWHHHWLTGSKFKKHCRQIGQALPAGGPAVLPAPGVPNMLPLGFAGGSPAMVQPFGSSVVQPVQVQQVVQPVGVQPQVVQPIPLQQVVQPIPPPQVMQPQVVQAIPLQQAVQPQMVQAIPLQQAAQPGGVAVQLMAQPPTQYVVASGGSAQQLPIAQGQAPAQVVVAAPAQALSGGVAGGLTNQNQDLLGGP